MLHPHAPYAPQPSAKSSHAWRWLLPALVAWGLCLGGCNQTLRAYEFTLKGSISLASGTAPSGPIVVELYHKQTGEGTLQQPLLFVSSFKLDSADGIDKTIEFPTPDDRTGLIIYAWHDADGDGSLCTATQQNEVSGLFEVQGFPTREVTLQLTLDQTCLGPEALYP